MDYHLQKIIDRRNTNCLKYDFAAEEGVPDDAIPLWVADMDFQVAPDITQRLEKIVSHAIYGYVDAKDAYYEAVANWYDSRFGYRPEKRWIIKTPGVVFAMATAVNAFTDPGDSVLIQQPVYHPFRAVVEENARCVINNPLVLRNGQYSIDFQDFEEKIVRNRVKLFLLCSPHNPVGRVWTEEELIRLEEICLAHDVLIVSDEIHSDFVWEGHRHHLLLSLRDEFAENTIVCTAPSKTFNIAGLQCSNIFIPDHALRKRFVNTMYATGYELMNTFAIASCQAAYEEGEDWLREVKQYIYENILFVKSYIEQNIPQIHMHMPEGTYLIWLDCSGLGMDTRSRREFLLNEAKIWTHSGSVFGSEGDEFERLNAACPRPVLEEALNRLKEAVSHLPVVKADEPDGQSAV